MRYLYLLILLLAIPAFVLGHSGHGHENEETVLIFDDRFEPENLEIDAGTTVTWVNRGEREHWPASDLHPTHTLYPTDEEGCIGSNFDACRGLVPEETYSFTFEEPGNWGVHDHISPGLTMRIVVQGSAEDAESVKPDSPWSKITAFFKKIANTITGIFERIFTDNNNTSSSLNTGAFSNLARGEQEEFLENLAGESPRDAWELLKETYIVNGEVIGNAHQLAHVVGNTAYRTGGFESIKICDTSFAYGCYHGVTEEMLRLQGPEAIKDTEKQCMDMFSGDYTGCIHGMGHGLFSWAGFDAQKALEICDELERQNRPYCYDGVFMEHSFSAPQNSTDARELWGFCTALPDKYHHNCARYRVQAFSGIFEREDIINACDKGPEEQLREVCYENIGYMLAQAYRNDIETGKLHCSGSAYAEGRPLCFLGIAREFVFQEYEGWRETSQSLCQELQGEWRRECVDARAKTAKIYNREL